MLSEPTIASLRGIASQALQESAQSAAFDDARAAVRDVVENVLAAAAEAQNAPRPTHRIPPELLAASFGYLDFADRVGASHVCRFWRSVALACPSLWTDIRFAVNVSNATRAETALRTLLARTGALPIHLVQTRRPPPPGVPPKPPGALNLAILLPHNHQLHTLSLDFVADWLIHGRTEILANLPLQVRHLSLRFTQATYVMTMEEQRSMMSRSLPMLTTLEICGGFLMGDTPWPTMPALKHLTLRTSQRIHVPNLATVVLSACAALETLIVVTLEEFLQVEDSESSPTLPALSSVVLRGGNLTGRGFCRRLIAALGCDRAAHITLHHIQGSHIPEPTEWTAGEFAPTELSFFQPEGVDYRGKQHQSPVVRFADVAGRSRTLLLFEQPRSFVMDMPPCMRTVTSLALDEADFGRSGFTPRSALGPALVSLTLRLSDATDDYSRLFARPDAAGVCRLEPRDLQWRCTALRRVELAYVPGAGERPVVTYVRLLDRFSDVPGAGERPVVTCGDLVRLLDRLSAPPTVALGLQNITLRDDDDEQAALRARVSTLEVRAEYEPLAVEREWPTWRIDEDRTLE